MPKTKPLNRMKLSFDAVSENESFARMVISAFVAQLNPTINDLVDIKTAVCEGVTNAIVHGYENKGGTVVMEAELYDNTVHIKITDTGKGIEDINKAREPFFTTRPEEERSGMGFTVMESFMDSLEVISEVGKGTTLIMTKTISSQGEGGS